jgi:hypothetical protein
MHFTFNAAVHELSDIGVRVEPYSTMFHNYTFLNLALANMWCVRLARPQCGLHSRLHVPAMTVLWPVQV